MAIHISLIGAQYQKMADEELIYFAKTESQHLTPESFLCLKGEFERRNIDLTAIESARIDRDRSESMQRSQFENNTANKFINSIWDYAFEEKENGTTNEELLELLIKKNIAREYACMMIESIVPQAREAASNCQTRIVAGWVLLISGACLAILTEDQAIRNGTFILLGIVLVVFGIVGIATGVSRRKRMLRIIENSAAEKENREKLYP